MAACKTINCIETASLNGYCANCRANHRAWSKREPGEIFRRRSNLQRYESRMKVVIDDRGLNEK